MAQRITFAPLPNTSPIAWHAALVPLLAEVDRAKPRVKALREWLRLRNLFDKEGFETLMAFLDVDLGEPVTLGPAARAMLEAADEPTARSVLGDRLLGENPLLAKYCLEALDVDKGGRLHSTNELYRMITSYVYPGNKPTLNAFKAWVDWSVSAGLLKMVGIRWALGDGGREALPRLRAIDAEEFLEEERAEAAGGAPSPAEAGEVGDVPPSLVVPVPSVGPALAMVGPGIEANVEGAAPAVGSVPAAAEATQSAPHPVPGTSPDRPVASRPAPAPTPLPPLPMAGEFPGAAASLPLDLAATRDALQAWYARWPGRAAPLSAGLGLPGGDAGVFEAAAVALWIARGMAPADAGRALAALRADGLLYDAGKGTLTVAALGSVASATQDAVVRTALEAAVWLPRLHAGVRGAGLLQAATPRDLLDRLWQRLYVPSAPLAPFVLARLLLEAGRLPENLAPAGLLPTYAVRENAFRIGFLDRLHAASFSDLVEGALALAAWFGGPDHEGPIAHVHLAFGCAFRCGRAPVCPLSCRERAEISPLPRA